MKNSDLRQDWGADYRASSYFESLGLEDVHFSWKEGTGNATGILFIKVVGVDTIDGEYIEKDMWPVYDYPTDTVAELVKSQPKDFVLRRGEHTDEKTGEVRRSWKWVTTHMDKSLIPGGTKRPGYEE